MLNEKLKEMRKSAGFTQQQVADFIEIQRSAYAYYETGKSRPKLEVLKKLAALYNVSVDEIINDGLFDCVAQSGDPDFNTGLSTSIKFDDLTPFEKSVIIKVRLMTRERKVKLMDFLCEE